MFDSEHDEMEEITLKLLKIINLTFSNPTYSSDTNKISLHALSIILMESKTAGAD